MCPLLPAQHPYFVAYVFYSKLAEPWAYFPHFVSADPSFPLDSYHSLWLLNSILKLHQKRQQLDKILNLIQQLLFYSGIGSTEDYWKRQDAAQVMAQVGWTFIFIYFHYFSINIWNFPVWRVHSFTQLLLNNKLPSNYPYQNRCFRWQLPAGQ